MELVWDKVCLNLPHGLAPRISRLMSVEPRDGDGSIWGSVQHGIGSHTCRVIPIALKI